MPSEGQQSLARLTAVFRRLGADAPEEWASSEVEEGIPQLGHFVFLKQAWQSVIDEKQPNTWFNQVARNGKRDASSIWGQLSRALQALLSAGVTREQLARVIQLLQYQTLNEMCFLLDGGGFSSPINASASEGVAPVRWCLLQVDDDANVVGRIDGLHEYSDGEPPNGRQSGFR